MDVPFSLTVLTFMTDITERKRAEEELRRIIAELAKFRRLAIGREQKMIKLKKEINELLKGIGYAEKYKIY